MSTTHEFHDEELDTFIADTTMKNLTENKLLTRFREDITAQNLQKSTNGARRRIRDYLENKDVPCDRGTGESIQRRLLMLLNVSSLTTQTNPASQTHTMATSHGNNKTSNSKRDISRASRPTSDQYSGPYDEPIIATVKRNFKIDCGTYEAPEQHQLSVLHVMFRDEALKYFTEYVKNNASDVEHAFQLVQEHFVTPANKDKYTTEWNNISFQDMRRKEPDKTTSQLLDLLYQRARDVQSMLDDAYQSPLLLRDCIIKAVKSEPFYAPLLAGTLPTDPDTLHTRLHQCIRQQETFSNASATPKSPNITPAYYVEEYDGEQPEYESEHNIIYNDRSNPYFKRRIMRGSTSFSTPDYKQPPSFLPQYPRFTTRGRGRSSIRPSRSRHITMTKIRDRSGNVIHCSFCNSWFHLIRDCPDKQQNHVNFAKKPTEIEPGNEQEQKYDANMDIDRSVDKYNLSPPHDTGKQQHNEHLYLSLEHSRHHEIDSPSHETLYLHNISDIPPHLDDVLHRHPHLKPNLSVLFHRFCYDEGAPQSVTGLNQWFAYLRTHHLPTSYHDIHKFATRITFGGKGKQKVEVFTIRRIIIRVSLPGYTFFEYESLLIINDVPILLGLATQLRLHTVTDKNPQTPTAHIRTLNVTTPFVFKLNHLYYLTHNVNEFLFSSVELAQIHKNLGHAPPGSVYSELRRTYPVETGANDLQKLQDISKSCKGCKLYSKQPNWYRTVLPDRCVLNFDVAIDVMFILGHPILHAVCRQTHFSRAAPLAKQDSYTIWETFMTIWVTPYLGVPYHLWVDQAKSFLSVQFKSLASSLGCHLMPITVEAHWSLIAESYHDPLRRIANKLSVDHPTAPLYLILDYANLAMSHTISPEGFTPAILAFGAQPRLPIGEYTQMPQNVTNRMDLMTNARREYEAIIATLRIKRAMNTTSPNEDTIELTPRDEVLVYREKKGWEGPYTFLYRDGRLSVVLDDKGHEHLFHSTMLKPYNRPTKAITDILNPIDDMNSQTIAVNLVEMIHDEDDPRFKDSRQKEYDGIVAKGGVKPVSKSDLPPNANLIGNRYVLCIKDPGTESQRFKARWILQGHHDKYRHKIANDSPMLMRMMYRVILAISTTFFDCTLWTRDVEQAFMQSKPLKRDVYTPAPPEAKLSDNKILKIELPHYGIVESSSCFFEAYYPIFTDQLQMNSSHFDPCFLYQKRTQRYADLQD